MSTDLDLSITRKIHCVGIGGAGMSAIALVLAAMGHEVCGSDLRDSIVLERLRAAGIRAEVGHSPVHIGDADAVSISTAVRDSNPEVVEAHRLGVAVHSRADTLAAIAARRRTIAVAGTHGKTTTSSMLALILVEAGLRPSFIIGGEVNEISTNAVWDEGEWLVVEADESDGTFLLLEPEIAVVTAVEPDHLNYYGSLTALTEAFERFVAMSRRPPVLSADDPGAQALAGAAQRSAVTFGCSESATYRASGFEGGRSASSFLLSHAGQDLGRFELPMPGIYNVLNAVAAIAAASGAGAEPEHARRALARFAGVARRFEFRGEAEGVTFVDDYAHLPGEVDAAIAAARLGGWARVVCVFQPHRYSRTQSLWRDFADSFTGADLLAVTGIYPAGEEPLPGVSGKLVVDAVLAAHPDAPAVYIPSREDLVTWLEETLRRGDLCLTLGAGDLTSLPEQLLGRARR
jgi:UDP-N-acetylmuramate--alanine ligase